MKRATLIIILLIAAYSTYATLEWRVEKEKIYVIKDYAVSLSDHPLLEIADAGSILEYLIENNASDLILRERIRQYSVSARTLEYSSLILYKATGDEKYRLFRTAMVNLKDFFISVNNRPDLNIVLKENLNIIKNIGGELEGKRITDLTKEEVERIFELSTELRYTT